MKKFKNFVNEEMSVTLKQHGSTSYKVHAVGSKMKQHGGFKVGDTVHDHHIDDLHDSGIKVRYHKEEVDVNEAIERKADSKMIMVKDPNTGRTILKRAPRKEIEIGKGKMESVEVNELSNDLVNKVAKKRAIKVGSAMMKADGDRRDPEVQKTMAKKKANDSLRFSRGARQISKAVGEETVNELSDTTKVNYINKANKAITDREKLHLKIGAKVDKDKTLEKMRKGVAMAKSKLGEDYSDKQVRMGKGVAFDKRYKDGNYSGAYKTINKIKKGLADHPKVKDALRRANEEFNKGE